MTSWPDILGKSIFAVDDNCGIQLVKGAIDHLPAYRGSELLCQHLPAAGPGQLVDAGAKGPRLPNGESL